MSSCDEDIPSLSPSFPDDIVAAQDTTNEVRIGPVTRSRAKLLEQQVKSLLLEYNVCDNMNFILPKSLHLCMIRFVDNTSARGREGASIGEEEEQQSEELKEHICAREEREAGAHHGSNMCHGSKGGT